MSILHAVLGGALRPVIRAMSQARRPQFEGKQVVEGLEAPVEVFRDSWSVPHIYASSPQDAFFAQGYVQAQDRLWQMEMNRRTGRGLLAQLFGEIALDTDRLIRTLGFNRLGQVDLDNLPDDLRHELDAYTAGVNACMEHIGNRLPIEFVLLGHRPEPWTPLDTMAFARVMIWQLSHAWVSEITRARLIEKVGDERAAELEIQYPERNPVTLPSGIQFNLIEPDGMLKAARGPFLNRGLEAGAGSNGWAIAACRSTTGHAVLCNDMHLALSAPSLWYTNHLSAGPEGADLHAAGVSLPGLPMVLVGHTARIAWGATLAFTDCEDLYIERLNPDDPHRYRFQDQWLEAELIPEVIPVKGRAEPHIEEVLMTRHGPLLDKALGYGTDELIDPETRKPLALAMQSMALRPCTAVQGWRLLNCAAGWDDFVEAVHLIEAPQLNLIYADVEDNIGHFVTGKVPVRAKGQGLVPAPGWTGDHEWVGTVPFEAMPHAFNPKEGYIVSSNHRIIGDDYPHFLGTAWMSGYRARRIVEIFECLGTVALADHARLHVDCTSLPGAKFVEKLEGLESEDPDVRMALDLLREWDCVLGPDSVGGTLFEVGSYHLIRRVIEPTLGEDLTFNYMGRGPHPLLKAASEFGGHALVAMFRLLDDPASWWITQAGGREQVLTATLKQAVVWLRQELGPDPRKWAWGRLHKAIFPHSLGVQPPFDRVFNVGDFPIGGGSDTVCQTAYLPDRPYNNNVWAPSFRQIIDMGDLAQVQTVAPPGQSGQIGSPHYDDQVAPWLTGEYVKLPWTREDVEQASPHKLTLSPG